MRPKFPSHSALVASISIFSGAAALAQDVFDWTPGTTVPDNNPVGAADTRNVIFDPAAVITGLEVRLELSGGWNGDLYASLVHDSGFTVLLNRPGNTASNPGGSGSSGMNITFSDSAATDIHTGIPNSGFVTGTWQPDARTADPAVVTDTSPRTAFLSSFNEAPVQGNWTLFLADNATADTSTLVSWGLTITSEIRDFAIWDANGNTAGIGGVGTWTSSSSTWATSNVGTSTAVQAAAAQLVFDGSGGAVSIDGTVAPAAGLRFKNNDYTISGGTLQMSGASAVVNSVAVEVGISSSIGSVIAGSNGMTKEGDGALILSGANTLSGNFDLKEGLLLAENTTGSATGTGGLSIDFGATLGGNGIIAPSGSASINVSGQLAPGTGIGTLTFDLSATSGSLSMAGGSGFAFELGTANSFINTIGLGSSDMIQIIGGGAADFVFSHNTIDFGAGGTNGYYKLFDTTVGSAELWSGLEFDTSSGLVSSGLTAVNLAPDRSAQFFIGTFDNGGDSGDIYLQVIPEPGAAFLGSIGMLFLLRRRR
jgi:autotransporter-associated beta strand protein